MRFCGIVEEPTCASVEGSRDLRDLGRLQPDDLRRDALGGRGDLRERVPQVAQPVARRVPVDVCAGEAKPLAEGLLHGFRALAERGERPGGPGELRGRGGLCRPVEAFATPSELVRPGRGLQPERDRHRVLEVRPPGHRGVTVAQGKRASSTVGALEIPRDRGERGPRLEDERRVDDVLRRRTPVHPAALVAAALDQRPNQRNQWMLRRRDSLAQLRQVIEARVRLGGDPLGRRCGDDADLGLSLGQGTLDVEPGLNERTRLEHRPRLARTVEIAKHLAVERDGHVRDGLRLREAYD